MSYTPKTLPSRKRLRELFTYRHGNLYRKTVRGGEKTGTKIGCHDFHGYTRAGVDGDDFQLHRLIWCFHFGRTNFFIDHINHIKTDNRIENLRLATKAQNEWHTKKRRHNTTGFKGVYRIKRKGAPSGAPSPFWAYIVVNGKRRGLKCHRTAKDAARAYNQAAKKLHGRFACLNCI
jgi:hypothetical protein